MSQEARRAAYRAGMLAEGVAAAWLTLRGFSVLARRFRCPSGEVDVVAKRGRLLVFVEVKKRGDLDECAFAVTARNRRRVEAAAQAFIARRRHLADCMVRYDVFAVAGMALRHHPDAWRHGE